MKIVHFCCFVFVLQTKQYRKVCVSFRKIGGKLHCIFKADFRIAIVARLHVTYTLKKKRFGL